MPRYDLEILIRARKEGNGIEESTSKLEGLRGKLKGALKTFKNVTAGAAIVGATFKEAFDLSYEGAQLTQLKESFDRLNRSALHTPDLLNEMSQAARGTISDSTLMAGVLKLAAGTTDEYAQTLANVSPKLVEIAKASNKLNPTLGDTNFLYESLTTAAKRQSVPIADNLGLIIKMDSAVRKVHPSLQGLASDYEDLTQQQKFLNELLFQGENLITQVGGDVSSQADAYEQLTVRVEEATNAVKQWLAGGLTPLIEASIMLAEANAKETELREAAETGIERINPKTKQYVRVVDEARLALFRQAAAEKEARSELHPLGIEMEIATDAGHNFVDVLSEITDEERKAMIAAGNLATDGFEDLTTSMVKSSGAIIFNNLRVKELDGTLGNAREEIARYRGEITGSTAAQLAFAESFRALNTDVEQMRTPVEDLILAQEDLALAQGDWVNVTRDTSDEITGINAELAHDLTDEQEDAMQDILDTVEEGSADWLNAYNALQGDLTDSQREALVAQRAELQAAHGEIVGVYTGDAKAAEEAQERIEEANAAISASYRKTALEVALTKLGEKFGEGALQAQLAYIALQETMGEITAEEAEILTEIATKTDSIDRVTGELFDRYLKDGVLSRQEIENIASAVSQIEENTGLSQAAIELLATEGTESLQEVEGSAYDTRDSFIDARNEADLLYERLEELDGFTAKSTIEITRRIQEIYEDPDRPEGAHQGGGITMAVPSLVGERGPEVIIPPQGGRVISNHELPRLGGGDTYIINNYNEESAALSMAMLQVDKHRRLNRGMGVK